MDALIKDVKYVSESRKKIDEKAHQIRDSQLRLPGVYQRKEEFLYFSFIAKEITSLYIYIDLSWKNVLTK